jgi:glycosyltransferase involved in cell wall biosynthesis
MRVLLMPSSYPPVLGGLQTAAHALARHLNAQRHEALVLTSRYPRTLKDREAIDGIQIHRKLFLRPCLEYLRNRRPDLWLASLYCYPATLCYARRLVDSFRPDVVNVHFPDAQIPFVLRIKRDRNFRLIVSLHGHEILRWFQAAGGPGEESLKSAAPGNRARQQLVTVLKEADAVTACSRYLLDKAIELEPGVAAKGHVIYNGIDPERFEDKTAFAHPRPYVLAYGRLTYVKGFDLLLRAFARVASNHPGIDLVIAGDGEQRVALGRAADDPELAGRVFFTGRASPVEVVRLLNGCLFVVVPSRREPFGITALEALAAGKPVLATRVGGLPEFLGDGAGLDTGARTMLVEPTVEGLSEGLRRWLALRHEIESRQEPNRTWLSCHTWAGVAGRYLQIYGHS